MCKGRVRHDGPVEGVSGWWSQTCWKGQRIPVGGQEEEVAVGRRRLMGWVRMAVAVQSIIQVQYVHDIQPYAYGAAVLTGIIDKGITIGGVPGYFAARGQSAPDASTFPPEACAVACSPPFLRRGRRGSRDPHLLYGASSAASCLSPAAW